MTFVTVAGFLMQWQEDQTEGVEAGISEYTCGFSLLWCFTGTPYFVASKIPSVTVTALLSMPDRGEGGRDNLTLNDAPPTTLA